MNILIGGLLGDTIMYLSMCNYISRKTNTKCNVYLKDDYFRQKPTCRTMEFTYNSLYNLIIKQEYINTFKKENINVKIDLDLTTFRHFRCRYLTNKLFVTWPEIYMRLYFSKKRNTIITPNKQKHSDFFYKNLLSGNENNDKFSESWLRPTTIYNQYENALVISRTNYRPQPDEYIIKKYIKIIQQYKQVYFVCYERHEAITFKEQFKVKVEPIYVKNLEQWINIIGSCEEFIGNMTSSSSIAYGLNQKRIVETWNDPVALLFAAESLINPKQRVINSYYNDFKDKQRNYFLPTEDYFFTGITI